MANKIEENVLYCLNNMLLNICKFKMQNIIGLQVKPLLKNLNIYVREEIINGLK